ncbi:maleylpyruvate isomerase family mycothiol-dependent enzyme [Streptomyces europaeiscabiei]|uniref:Maleylpyruvate isomerase family mycothiol-dependent enzyme n=1 Tax=Streptomyces europaeiscabiei TaxID=146819 RepID=A0AAJ2PLK1_9ACTN|nr:maleylpyruvate isomerase family mycothiol-dependent enzyme [Streptomyces europaeiscabiei]MDX3129747.1 maleylpyruvate isomerase family mycothiol-dependent enzyme [Streptomyces europaeiscabiei]
MTVPVPVPVPFRVPVPVSVVRSRAWAETGQLALQQAVDALPADAVTEPSALPGWTRGHLLTHLARNADALVNLLTWARTGIRTPMYSSPDQRATDIEAGAGRSLGEQQADIRESATRFREAAEALSADAWSATVVSAQGREIPASEVPWLRAREVWIHLVDLHVGVGMDALPPDFAWALAGDVAGWMSARLAPGVGAELSADGHNTLVLGTPAPGAAVGGPPYAVAAWLTGRGGTEELHVTGELPDIPRWL